MTYEDSGWLGRDPKFIFLYFLCFFILKPIVFGPLVFLYSRWTTLRTEKGAAMELQHGTLLAPCLSQPPFDPKASFLQWNLKAKQWCCRSRLDTCGLLGTSFFKSWLFDLIPQNGAGRFHLLKNKKHTVSGKESRQRDLKLGSTDEQIPSGKLT